MKGNSSGICVSKEGGLVKLVTEEIDFFLAKIPTCIQYIEIIIVHRALSTTKYENLSLFCIVCCRMSTTRRWRIAMYPWLGPCKGI
jgi:hypothetical protein